MAQELIAEANGQPFGVVTRVARELGVGTESLRGWLKQAEIDRGRRPGTTSAEAVRITELEREVRELRRANDILKAAAAESTRQRNSAASLSAGVSKSSVFLGRLFSLSATASRSAWVRPAMLTPFGKY
jgi:transposase